ncbi:hypothetical protein MU1_29240 [Paenibacillus glycanilyticus]|uniref:Uncharacterized protein n=1 Tax=Paenibacillus glycanilyticus TaxID=126569 RepID=A0ABQ6GCC4_9BACL|nr:hypothetical protein MU1_29240 [Paenibacillus glycanilyticus]
MPSKSGYQDEEGSYEEADEVGVFEIFGGDLPVMDSQPKAATQKDWATDLTNVRQATRLLYLSFFSSLLTCSRMSMVPPERSARARRENKKPVPHIGWLP